MTKTTEAVAEERVRELRDQKQAHFDAGYTRNLENNDVLSICSELLTSRQQIGELRQVLRMVKHAAIQQRGEDFNLSSAEWAVFHAALGAP